MTRRFSRWLAAVLAVIVLTGMSVSVGAAATGDRSLVSSSQLTERPFRGITLVSVGDRIVCTGFIVGKRKVVTAAHCLTRDAAKGNFRFRAAVPGNIRLFRAYSQIRGGTRYQVCRVSKAWAHPKFIKRNSSDGAFGSRAHDYAVLTTKPGCTYPSNAFTRLWATTPSDGQLRAGQIAKMAGYPADPRFTGMNGLNLWRTRGKLQRDGSDTRLINTTGFVAQGMSGGPLWRSFGKGSPCDRAQCVIGIVTECEVNARGLCKTGDSIRRAVRITPTVKQAIKAH
jgi:V8-like Glu-specific endopeptidase